MSAHVLGAALVDAAGEEGLELTMPSDVMEEPGQGIAGIVEGHRIAVGSRTFFGTIGVPPEELASASLMGTRGSGETNVLVAIDGHVGGVIVMGDELRPDAIQIVTRLRAEGVRHVAMISGDRRSVAERVGRELGVVRTVRADPNLSPVMMVGDGINDAPRSRSPISGSRWEPPARTCPPRPPTP
jgi:cation transport ATPase